MSTGNLSDDEVKCITELFHAADTQKDGKLSVHELRDMLHAFGFKVDDKQCVSMFNEFDKDGSGTLSLDEFVNIFGKKPRNEINEANIERIFRSMDADENGTVTPDEIREALNAQGIHLRKGELEDMMSKVDKDNDGKLSVPEFKKIWCEICG